MGRSGYFACRHKKNRMGEEVILCDSNILINWFKNDAPTKEALEKIGLNQIMISSITRMELYQGCRDKNELHKMKQRLNNYNILHFNEGISQLAERLVEKYKLSNNLQIPDAIIGASSIHSKIPLFTYNVKDFSFMPGIKLFHAHPTGT